MDTTRHLQKIRQLINAGHTRQALTLLRPLRRMFPADDELLWEEARCLEATGQLVMALEHTNASLAGNATRAAAWLMRARLLGRLQPDCSSLEADIGQALQLDPALAEAHAALAVLRHEEGQPALAMAAIGRAIRLAPQRSDYLCLRATWHELAAWRPDPREATVRQRDGTRLALAALQGALQDYQELTQREPENPRHWLKSARLLELLQCPEQARAAHEAGWQLLAPEDPRRAWLPGQTLAPRYNALRCAPLPLLAPLAPAQRLLGPGAGTAPASDDPHMAFARQYSEQRFQDGGFSLLLEEPVDAGCTRTLAWCGAWRSPDGLFFATDLLQLRNNPAWLARLTKPRLSAPPCVELFSALSDGRMLVTSQATELGALLQHPQLLFSSVPAAVTLPVLVATHRDRMARYLALHRDTQIQPIFEASQLRPLLERLFTTLPQAPENPPAAAPEAAPTEEPLLAAATL